MTFPPHKGAKCFLKELNCLVCIYGVGLPFPPLFSQSSLPLFFLDNYCWFLCIDDFYELNQQTFCFDVIALNKTTCITNPGPSLHQAFFHVVNPAEQQWQRLIPLLGCHKSVPHSTLCVPGEAQRAQPSQMAVENLLLSMGKCQYPHFINGKMSVSSFHGEREAHR